VPWVERYERATKLMAQAVVVWLKAYACVNQVMKFTRLNWHKVNTTMKAPVVMGSRAADA
jgi:hypothetical protein